MPCFTFVVFISRPRESKREMSCVYAHPFRVFFVWFCLKISSLLPQTNRALLCGKLREKERDSKDKEAIFEGASDRNPWDFLRSLSFSLTIELFCSKILSIEFLVRAKRSSRMSSFTSACSSIDFGFSQCFGGWQNASVEVKLSAGQSFPATATGMDVTESVSDLASKTFILTGATGTLGRACAKILRARGCKLIFASRDVEKASAFVGEMEKEDFEGEDEGEDDEEEKDEEKEADEEKPKKKKVTMKEVTILKCDLSSVHSVKSFCREFQKLALPLHGILCLAGVVVQPFALTKPDGVETHFAINHLSHYAMVSFLSDELTRTAAVAGNDGKVVLVSSNAHHWSYRVRRGTTKPSRGIDFENLNSSYGYSAINSYGQSKLCPILHAWRISETVNGVRAFAVNPGQFGEELSKQFGEYFGGSIVHSLVAPFTKVSVEVASATVLLCLTNSGLPPGVYYSECKPTRSSLPSRDPRLATQLCDESDEMIREILAKKHVEFSGENESGGGGGGGSDSPKVPRSPGGMVMMTSPAKMSIGGDSPRGMK